jgi:hypothetical protein
MRLKRLLVSARDRRPNGVLEPSRRISMPGSPRRKARSAAPALFNEIH